MAKAKYQEPIVIGATDDIGFQVHERIISLDVGCGKAKRGDIGIDYSRRSDADVIADSHFLPFKDDAFESILSTVVLEHSPNPLVFLKEQFRVLRSGGEVKVVTDNAQYYCWSVMGFGEVKHEDYHSDHYEIFFPRNVERLLTKAGFTKTGFRFLRTRHSKMDCAVAALTKIGLLRRECLFSRFEMTGKK
ncbi:methyltransferase domain-containing protein [Candidatus Bathyarchaeota archaeon]|nr:methyltransferase domain-containing protein [Candidatus Bathyarchaeota archaeon]